MVNLKNISGLFITLFLFFGVSCNSQNKPSGYNKEADNKDVKYKVTFIELGSVRCNTQIIILNPDRSLCLKYLFL
jgi:hypothetical protein